MDLRELRKTSLEFRRLASNALRTNYEEGNLHLIRLRKYIEENTLVNRVLMDEISDIQVNYKEEFVSNDGGWSNLNIPVDRKEHMKAIYDYLKDVTDEEKDIRGEARKFYCSSNKWNDIVRNFSEKLFKPLIDFIIDSISMEMMIESSSNGDTNINQYIETNYGTANIAKNNISSTNEIIMNEKVEINKLAQELIDLVEHSKLDNDVTEEIVDDIDTILDQVNSDKPKHVKIKKACKGLMSFIISIPNKIATAELVVEKSQMLISKVEQLMDKVL